MRGFWDTRCFALLGIYQSHFILTLLAGFVFSWGGNEKKEKREIRIKGTQRGRWGNTENLPVNINKIHTNQIIVDASYNPIETEWIKLSRKKGAFCIGGLDMFIFQGFFSAEIWEIFFLSNSLNFFFPPPVLKLELC
jgi:Shikimate 5-dehydrogenase